MVAVFPSGSTLQSDINTVHAYLKSHCESMSTPEARKEREFIMGDAPADFATGGHDAIGDTTTDPSYIYRATAYDTKRAIYIAPTKVYRTDGSGNTMHLDANYAACAMAGAILSKNNVRSNIPQTGKQLVGFTIENEKWTDTEKDYMGGYGVCILESRANVVTVRHALTTDVSSAETAEDSVVQQENMVKRSLRTGLEGAFKGKVVIFDHDF